MAINIPWCFTIVLFGALVLNLFIPIFQSFDHVIFGCILTAVSGFVGAILEDYFLDIGWRKKK